MRFRLLLHEWAAVVFTVAGIVVLERLPVTYPRSALLLAFASPIAIIFALAALMSAIRLRGRGVDLRGELLHIARCCWPILIVFSTSFLLKSFIHLVNPRVYDRLLVRLDQTIHFGFSPTVFLTTLFDNALLLGAIDRFYTQVYYVIFMGGTAALLAFLPPARRTRFAAAFVLMWMSGTLLYLLLPSWGPAFSATPLVENALRHMPATVWVQSQLFQELDSLVRNPLAPRMVKFGSVAAFPSLHVGVVTLFTIAVRNVWRPAYLFGCVSIAAMLIGSVVTGYHFLIDGYAGAILAVGSWMIARRSAGAKTPSLANDDARRTGGHDANDDRVIAQSE